MKLNFNFNLQNCGLTFITNAKLPVNSIRKKNFCTFILSYYLNIFFLIILAYPYFRRQNGIPEILFDAVAFNDVAPAQATENVVIRKNFAETFIWDDIYDTQ
jgi:hypothetical protein